MIIACERRCVVVVSKARTSASETGRGSRSGGFGDPILTIGLSGRRSCACIHLNQAFRYE